MENEISPVPKVTEGSSVKKENSVSSRIQREQSTPPRVGASGPESHAVLPMVAEVNLSTCQSMESLAQSKMSSANRKNIKNFDREYLNTRVWPS